MNYQPKGLKKIYHQLRRCLAKNWLKLVNPLQIAITGSQGKTTTTQILAFILSKIAPTVVTDINLDTIYNVPITALKAKPWTKYAVFELGVDHIGEMDKHLEIVKPKIGIITGISPVHTDAEHFGSLENLIKEKRKLIEKLPDKKNGGVAILNFDDENVRKMASFTKAKVIFYGSDKKNCPFFFDKKSVRVTIRGTSFIINNFKVKIPLIGLHHPSNLTAVYAALSIISPNDKEKIKKIFLENIKKFKPLRGRMNIEKGPKNTLLLNDCLRANPKSTEEGLKTFYAINYQKGRKIAVLGIMGELYNPIKEHQQTGKIIAQYPPDIIIGIGNFRRYTIEEAIKNGYPKKNAFFAKDVFEAADFLKTIIKPNDFIYLKGSLLRNLWRIIKILKKEAVCCNKELCPYNHCRF